MNIPSPSEGFLESITAVRVSPEEWGQERKTWEGKSWGRKDRDVLIHSRRRENISDWMSHMHKARHKVGWKADGYWLTWSLVSHGGWWALCSGSSGSQEGGVTKICGCCSWHYGVSGEVNREKDWTGGLRDSRAGCPKGKFSLYLGRHGAVRSLAK